MSKPEANEHAGNAHPLDDVVWRALTGKQSRFALGNERARRYPPAITAFAAMADSSAESFEALSSLLDTDGPAALVTTCEVQLPPAFSVVRRARLSQMIWQGKLDGSSELPHVRLAESDVPDMLALTTATQPGPFGPRTIELGRYIGVRSHGTLAAMAGERMQIDGFTEISAVCVDSAFRGKGYAAGLMRTLIEDISMRGETPFLHVFTTNHAAINIYRALGFVERREMHLAVVSSTQVSR